MNRPVPMAANVYANEEFVDVYMCLTDFECELGMAAGGIPVYSSEQDLRRNKLCVDECGIVKVRIIGLEVVQEAIEGTTEIIETHQGEK